MRVALACPRVGCPDVVHVPRGITSRERHCKMPEPSSLPDGTDVAWSIVLSRENRSMLSALSLVSRRFFQLTTSEDLFRIHALRLEPSLHVGFSRDHPLPWRRAYRRTRALEFESTTSFHDIRISHSSTRPLHLLWSCATTECAVFFDAADHSLVGWPRNWRLGQVADTHTDVSLRSSILPLSVGVFGCLSVHESTLTLAVVCGKAGTVLARHHVELGCALCTMWTSALPNSPWWLKAAGDGIVVCSVREILYFDCHSGAILKRWSRKEVGDAFAFFVRGECNDCLVGYQNVTGDHHEIRSIVDNSVLAQFQLGPEERLVDLVLNEIEGILACRVVSARSRVICIVFLKERFNRIPSYLAKVRIVLHSEANSVTSLATLELMIQRSIVIYKPDASRPFPGPIVAIARRQGEDSFCTLRFLGERFLGALLTSNGQALVTCNDTEVQLYRLSSGECIAAHLLKGLFEGLFLLGVPTHAIGLLAGSNFSVLHFSLFCGSTEYPRCSFPKS